MKPQTIDPEVWRNRCARRITELDPEITIAEAKGIAADFHTFERTRAMNPEDAADFVAAEMNRPEAPRFERRSPDRPENAPLLRSILRYLKTRAA
ncbi:MAG: hypothetical protein ACXWCV_16750 [Caldimonas sp.]